jgi:hypothetical protein
LELEEAALTFGKNIFFKARFETPLIVSFLPRR